MTLYMIAMGLILFSVLVKPAWLGVTETVMVLIGLSGAGIALFAELSQDPAEADSEPPTA